MKTSWNTRKLSIFFPIQSPTEQNKDTASFSWKITHVKKILKLKKENIFWYWFFISSVLFFQAFFFSGWNELKRWLQHRVEVCRKCTKLFCASLKKIFFFSGSRDRWKKKKLIKFTHEVLVECWKLKNLPQWLLTNWGFENLMN